MQQDKLIANKMEWKRPTLSTIDIKMTLTGGSAGGDLAGQTGLD